ncbi:hypothetical protein LPJ61_000995 [Coemansia biformis]|uniref:carboxypeptidase C n=1 Tax=Coemansia biformis TaxID=1286918 RepID=A0A9W8D0I6_9FUNG|nr:hypothetical protein LPJ61_000995 [Coemansia biformis]
MRPGVWLALSALGVASVGRPLAEPWRAAAGGSVSSPAICDPGVQQYSGFISVAPDRHLFYWFFEARSAREPWRPTPLILWLNGGPGCSSLSGLFGSVGPCRVDDSGNGTVVNGDSWNTNAHMLFLDQPVNTGFSFGANVTRTTDAARDVAGFLRLFYAQFPQYSLGELHVMGESYGAHYVPAIAAQILDDNQSARVRRLPLASIAIGNGLFDLARQYMYLPQMACGSMYSPAANATTCGAMVAARTEFARQLEAFRQQPSREAAATATAAGYDILTPYQLAGGNPYDVRTLCAGGSLCDPYMDVVAAFANKIWVRAELGICTPRAFDICNSDVQRAFIDSGDELEDATVWLPGILAAGVRVLNFVGTADLICNWMGNEALMQAMPWPGQRGFTVAPDQPWRIGGRTAGLVRAFGGLTLLRVADAGHMVARDQPAAALAMLTQWLDYRAILA